MYRSDTDAVTTTEVPAVSEKGVGKGGGARCLSFFLVALARENDSSHFSFFSTLPPCNAIFRFHAFGISDIESKLKIVFLWTPHKRGAKHTTISNKLGKPLTFLLSGANFGVEIMDARAQE